MVLPNSQARGHRPALDGLRAFALVTIVLYHLGLPGLPGGFLSVDLFFVLSGYLITGLLFDAHDRFGRIDLARFWRRRARRLLPALLLLLVVVPFAVRQWEPAGAWAARRGEMFGGLFYYANWHMIAIGQSYFDAIGGYSPLEHLWTLSIEEQFYTWWPLTLLLLLRWRPSWLRLTTVVAVLATASAVAMVLVYSADDPTRAYVGTDARAQELLIGALLVLVMRRYAWSPRRAGALGGAAVAVAVGMFLVVPDSGGFYYRGGATLVSLVFAVLIWSVEMAPDSAVAKVFSVRPLCWVGSVSYGLYLWHLPVIKFLPDVLPGRMPSLATDVACVAATVALASISYYAVERPIRHGRLRFAFDSTPRVAITSAVAVGLCALLVFSSTSAVTGLQAEQVAAARRAQEAAAGAETDDNQGTYTGPRCSANASICKRLNARPGQPTIAVLGDSIMLSLDAGFYDLAYDKGWGYVMAAHNGCGLTNLLNVDLPEHRAARKKCADETVPRIQQVLDEYHPDLVIASSRWDLVAHEGPGGETVKPMTAQWAADVQLSLRTFAEKVVRSGAGLAMVSVMPAAPAGGHCIENSGDRACASTPDALTAATNDIHRRVSGEVPGMKVVSMQDVLCPADQCRAVIEGGLVRYDGIHFSENGARWFVKALAPRLPTFEPRR